MSAKLGRTAGRRRVAAGWVAALVVCGGIIPLAAPAKLVARRVAVGQGGGNVNLPHMVNDNKGQIWRVDQNGYLQNQGPTPNGGNTYTFNQSAVLTIDGNNPQQTTNTGRVDEKTGELILEGLQGTGYTITRRIFVDKEGGYVRYIDVIKNTQGQDRNAQVTVSANFNYGIQTSQNVTGKKDETIGWVCQTQAMACLFEMYAGKGSKVAPTIMAQQNNSTAQAMFQVRLPANKEVALMHLHGMVPTQDAGVQFMKNPKLEATLLKGVPREIRKLLVNFAGGQSFIGDFEVLRGDLLDVVELRSGDQLKGTLKEAVYELDTFFGPVTLPVERVIGVINVGQFRPRQLVVMADGQVFGGRLKKETLDLQLSSGQVTQVPVSQVSRAGYRKRPGEPEEWTFEKPVVLMRSGERVGVKMPAGPLEVMTRYGRLSLSPEQVAAVVLQSEESGVHQVFLADGSKFSGLLTADQFEMTLEGAGTDQVVKFPASGVGRFQLTPKVAEIEDATPTLALANDDLLVGTVGGELKVDTTFDTITVNAAEVRGITHAGQNPADVQVVLFDGSTVSGQLQESELPVQLAGGLSLKVPVALLVEYSQPQPAPSAQMTDRIKKLIEDMNSQDWKTRDRAQAALTEMGPVAISVLRQLRDNQPPEVQKRITDILQDLEKQQKERNKSAAGAGAPGAPPMAVPPGQPFPMIIRD